MTAARWIVDSSNESNRSPVGSPESKIVDVMKGSPGEQSPPLPDLTNYLSQPKMSVRRLLKHTLSVKLIIAKHPQITEYLTKHIGDLLSIAFSEENILNSTAAYNVFSHLQGSLIEALTYDDSFSQQVSKVLDGNKPLPMTLSKICSLTALALTVSYMEFPPTCTFLIRLLDFIEYDCILDFISEITQEDASYAIAQEWLAENGFVDALLSKMNEIEISENADPYTDENCSKLRNIYNAVKFSETSPQLVEQLRCGETIAALTRHDRLPDHLEDARWDALLALYDETMVDEMSGLFERALGNLTEPYVRLSRFRVSSLTLLTRMLKSDRTLTARFDRQSVFQVLLRTIFQFQANSFVLLECQSFVAEALKHRGVGERCAAAIIPPLVFEGTRPDNITLSNFTFNVVDLALAQAARDRAFKAFLARVEGVEGFLRSKVKNRRRLMAEQYGGRLPIAWA